MNEQGAPALSSYAANPDGHPDDGVWIMRMNEPRYVRGTPRSSHANGTATAAVAAIM